MKKLPNLQFLIMLFVLCLCMYRCTKKKQVLTRQDSIVAMQAQVDSLTLYSKQLQNEKDSIPLTRDSIERDRFWSEYQNQKR